MCERANRWMRMTAWGLVWAGAMGAGAGPLDPPAGAIAPTYKTLAEVEARTAINAANTPGDADSVFKITQPGSYYLTGNITGGAAGKQIGIEVTAGNVTIDLNGFVIDGVGQLKTGVYLSGAIATLRNGSIRNLTAGRGVWINNSGAIVEDVRASDTAGPGFQVDGDHATLRRVTAIYALVGVEASVADFLKVEDSTFGNCFDAGIRAGTGATIDRTTVNATTSALAPSVGIRVGPTSVVRDCKVWTNEPGTATRGIDVAFSSRVNGCVVKTNGTASTGIYVSGAGVTIAECTITGNSSTGDGVYLQSNTLRTRVDNNSFDGLATGVNVNGTTNNAIVRNSFTTTTQAIGAYAEGSNVVGPIVTLNNDTTATNPLANMWY